MSNDIFVNKVIFIDFGIEKCENTFLVDFVTLSRLL